MDDRGMELRLPLFWPAQKQSGDISSELPPFAPLLAGAQSLFGITHGIDRFGPEWLSWLLAENPDMKCRLMLTVYPACPTRREDLQRLLDMQETTCGQAQFRLVFAHLSEGLPASTLALGNEQQLFLVHGAFANLGLRIPGEAEVNVAQGCSTGLCQTFRCWFDAKWATARPLTSASVEIPPLVSAKGSSKNNVPNYRRSGAENSGTCSLTSPKGTAEAAAMWEDYVLRCSTPGTPDEQLSPELVTVAREAGRTDAPGDALDSTGTRVGPASEPSPTAGLVLPQLDELAEEMDRLYRKGELVSIDKATWLPPLAAPMKAKWFGLDSFRQIGAVSREIRYRVSLFDEATLRDLEKRRRRLSDLLDRLTFPLADGAKWIPNSAKALLQRDGARQQ